MANRATVLCFGEILWDSTYKGLFLGGAPANVAYHLHRLGVRALPVSAVGQDFLGDEIIRRVKSWGVESGHVSLAIEKRTGVVQVDLEKLGNPVYEIVDDVAWDAISETPGLLREAAAASAIVFGSLALRHSSNQILLTHLLSLTSGMIVFDVNLRPPFFDSARVLALARRADLVKLNIDELEVLHPFAVGSIEVMAAIFSEFIGGKRVCVTCGSDGAGYWDGARWHWEEALSANAAGDAVGAGDAFLAGLIAGLTAGLPANESLTRACRLAEFVAGHDGAQPDYGSSLFETR